MNTQIYDEASEWIILHRTDTLDADAKRRFDNWLRESPQHLKAYLEMSTIWEEVPALNRDWNPSADELIARAREDIKVVPLNPHPPADTGSSLSRDPHPRPLSSNEERGEESHQGGYASADSGGRESLPLLHVRGEGAESSRRMRVFSIAATLLLMVGTAVWFYVVHNVYATGIGEQRTLALTDGSTVELNARTKIRVAYTDQTRTIELLQGQALFIVAKDPKRPFIVDSNGTYVRAVGTQFDVYRKDAATTVTVVEGRVAVGTSPPSPLSEDPHPQPLSSNEEERGEESHQGGLSNTDASGTAPRATSSRSERERVSAQRQPLSTLGDRGSVRTRARDEGLREVLLAAGEQLTVSVVIPASTQIVQLPVPKVADVEAATAWTQQRFVFGFTPLTEVAEEFNRYNRRRLVIDDPSLETFNISGSFSSTDPTLLLRFLREQPGIAVNETASEIRISRQGTSTG